MEAEKMSTRCPSCGGMTAAGELNTAGYGASLQWCAARKVPRKHPIRFLKNEYFHLWKVRVGLMGLDLTLSGEEIPLYVPAWYCPNCEKVFAWFDAPGVPPELCGEETTKRMEGAQ